MSALTEIRNDPSSLGQVATDADAEQFIAAVRVVMNSGLSEQDAINVVWGDGDYTARMDDILAHGYCPARQAQMIKPYQGPAYLISPVGDESDADDIEVISDALAAGTAREIASGLLGWAPYIRIVRVDARLGGSVDYLLSW